MAITLVQQFNCQTINIFPFLQLHYMSPNDLLKCKVIALIVGL